MKKAIFTGLIVVLLMVTAVALGCAPKAAPAPAPSPGPSPAPAPAKPAKPEMIYLSAGSTTSTSGAYVWAVAVGRVINKYAPGISVTVIESGGGLDNARRIKDGFFDFSLADGWNAGYEMFYGRTTFEGDPWEPIRWFFLRNLSASRTYVRADSGIKTFSDLKGRKIYAGQPGSSAQFRITSSNEFLQTGAEFIPGSLGDAVTALKMGTLEAVHKSCPIDTFDSALLAAHQTTPLTVLGFTDEEAAKLKERYPQHLVTQTPAGAISKVLPELGPVWEIYTIAGSMTTSKLPQDVGYRIMKAVYEHWADIYTAYKSSADYDPIKSYIELVPEGMEVKLHAGTVQYAKEIGIEVPEGLIPPEYKP